MIKYYAMGAAALCCGALGVGFWFAQGSGDGQFAQCGAASVASGGDPLGGPFELTSHTGERMTDTDLIDAPTLIYFGYSYCPDVCPLDTARNAEVVDLLAERDITLKSAFITIDPDRDTPEVLADFVPWVHPDMIGLTGSSEEIASAIREYRVYAARSGDGEDYLMDHSTHSYLMAPEHGLLQFYRRDAPSEAIAENVACFMKAL